MVAFPTELAHHHHVKTFWIAGLTFAFGSAGSLAVGAQPTVTAELRKEYARPIYVPFPPENLYTAEREMLGRTLFFDPRLSGSNLLSCASCHNPSFGWGDGQALGRGQAMVQLTRRSPTLLNVAWGSSYFWDGRAPTLEMQARGPISNGTEMNMPIKNLSHKVAAIPGYSPLFQAAYPGQPISIDTITRALATFERGIVSSRSDFDRWVEGEDAALNPAERRGLDVFVGPAGCARCHSGWAFTDGEFHDTGLASTDIGRGAQDPDNPLAQYAFKTPGLRDTVRRAPYMHDGNLPTLEAVVRFYETGGEPRPSRSPLIRPLDITPGQRADLVAFLQTLTAPPQEFAAPALPY
jgi:cytochrome c peroxidase